MGDCVITEYDGVLVFGFQVVRETWGRSSKRVHDYTLYTGALGTAYLLFKAYQVAENDNDLKLCSEIVEACDSASRDSGYSLFPYSYLTSIEIWKSFFFFSFLFSR